MADMLTLGAVPKALLVNLVKDADFVQQFTRSDGSPWPAGAQLRLELTHPDATATTWEATLTDQTAVWNVDKAEVNDVILKRVRVARLRYIQDSLDLTWAQGDVEVTQ
jgi:hypothetical protein